MLAAFAVAIIVLVGAVVAPRAEDGIEPDMVMVSLWAAARQGDAEAAYRLGRYHESRCWLAEREPEIAGNPADLVIAHALFTSAEQSSGRLDALYGRNETRYRLNQIIGGEWIATELVALPEWLRPRGPEPAPAYDVPARQSIDEASLEAPASEEVGLGSDEQPGSSPALELEPQSEREPEPELGPAPDLAPKSEDKPDGEDGSTASAPRSELKMLMARGASYLEAGDPVSARGFFRLAARYGSGEAAMMVAMTYDPRFLETLGVVGLRPDIERARKWYLRAVDLGHTDAETRMHQLDDQRADSRR